MNTDKLLKLMEMVEVEIHFKGSVKGTSLNIIGTDTAIKAGIHTIISRVAEESGRTVLQYLEDFIDIEKKYNSEMKENPDLSEHLLDDLFSNTDVFSNFDLSFLDEDEDS